MIWTPCDWLNKFYGFYMVAIVGIDSGHGLELECIIEINLIRES